MSKQRNGKAGKLSISDDDGEYVPSLKDQEKDGDQWINLKDYEDNEAKEGKEGPAKKKAKIASTSKATTTKATGINKFYCLS